MNIYRHWLLRTVIVLAAAAVVIPVGLLLVWSFVNRWPWPELIPSAWTLRGIERLLLGYLQADRVLLSSILLSLVVAVFSTVIATMAARALCLYRFPGKSLVEIFTVLPVIVPATVFGMGSHMLFIQLQLNNTVAAVMVSHLICTLPFAVRILVSVTRAADRRLEEQAQVLGAPPGAAFRHGTLPVISPGIVSAMAVSFLLSYTQYFLTMLMGGGKIKTLSIIVMPLIAGGDRTISSVYSVLFIGSTLAVFLLFQGVSNLLAKKIGSALGA